MLITASSTDEWQEVASRTFVPLQCESTDPAFSGSLEVTMLGSGISVCDVSSRPAIITRTSRLATDSVDDSLYLSLQMRSTGVIVQDSNSTSVHPGSVAVYASHIPHRLDYSASSYDQRQLVVQVPRRALGISTSTIGASLSKLEVSASPAREVFFSYVMSLASTHDALDTRARESFGAVTAELAATMLRSSETGHRLVPSSAGSLLVTIQAFIRKELGSAELSLDDIARAHFISRRKLYDLFAQVNTTPSAYIRDQRLSLASKVLADPHSTTPISRIALNSGFSDVTTFTRAFRKRYGVTPREWRLPR